MKVIAWVVGDLHTTREHWHFHAGGKVGRPKDDGLDARAGGANLFYIDEPACSFDLRFDTDVSNW